MTLARRAGAAASILAVMIRPLRWLVLVSRVFASTIAGGRRADALRSLDDAADAQLTRAANR